MAKVIGVTGGIGSGKSTVSQILKEYGAKIIDADEISRDIIKKGGIAYNEIIGYFGQEILNSVDDIDRKKLSDIVFKDDTKLDILNNIMHKYVIQTIDEQLKADDTNARLMVVDAPIPLKHGFIDRVDEVWVVIAEVNKRIERVMKRSGLTYEETIKRINAQMSDDEYISIADKVLINNESVKSLEVAVKNLIKGDSIDY